MSIDSSSRRNTKGARSGRGKDKRCPIPNCQSKPQKRMYDHIRMCHKDMTPRKRKRYCRIAQLCKRKTIRQGAGQRKLNFASPRPQVPEEEDDFKPIFTTSKLHANSAVKQRSIELQQGRVGSTRNLGSSQKNTPVWWIFASTLSHSARMRRVPEKYLLTFQRSCGTSTPLS